MKFHWTLVLLTALLSACATEITQQAVSLKSTLTASAQGAEIVTTKAVNVVFDSRYARAIAADTVFIAIGHVPQGQVLKPKSTVFAIEGAHMHEAYLVVLEDKIVGFYLPVEKTYSPLTSPIPISLNLRK